MNKVLLSPAAAKDLTEIKDYITAELENPIAAANTVGHITKELRILINHAQAGALLSSVADVESDYRFLISGSYLSFYRIQGDHIYVDRILYGRRDYLRVLFDDHLQDADTQ